MASKGKGKEKVKSPPPPVEVESPTSKEVVPGKLSEKAWLEVLNRAEGTEIATELVNEVFEVAFSVIYSHYLEKQAFPHSVSDAQHSLLRIIEWQFLARDEGESQADSDPSWVEDEEPVPTAIDSWARGVVPTHSLSTLDTTIESMDPVRVQSSLPDTSVDVSDVTDRPESGVRGSTVSSTRKSAPKKKTQSRARPVAHHTKARLVPIQPPTTDPADDSHTDTNRVLETGSSAHSHTPTSLTAHTPHPPHPLPYGMKPIQLTWQKEVSYNERGNIVDMVRLDPTKFPRHSVKPVVTLVKPPPTLPPNKPTRRLASKPKRHTHQPIAGELSRREANKGPTAGGRERESRRFPEVPALPPLVDTIDPVAGVTVSEAGRSVRGPKPHSSVVTGQTHHPNLRSLQPTQPAQNTSRCVGGKTDPATVKIAAELCV